MKTRRICRITLQLLAAGAVLLLTSGCKMASDEPTAEEILGNPAYPALSYSGWRVTERDNAIAPTVEELKEDMRLIAAMGIRLIRTYNTQDFVQTERMLAAIRELKEADPDFEMNVMLGAWIRCFGEDTPEVDHGRGDEAFNKLEIELAIEMAATHPDIIKIIAVGNEAMVHWQPHHVAPGVILKWVRVLQEARETGRMPKDIWITTSENWAALGGEEQYHNADLVELLGALDFISLHTYAFHDTYYHPDFEWAIPGDAELPLKEQRKKAVERAVAHQKSQLEAVRAYMLANGVEKAIHIGETGWATRDDSHYGPEGTHAADEYTSMLFHNEVRAWTESAGMSCFYFQAFDEPWKSSSVDGSESHFGHFTNEGQAKAVIWHLVDTGIFDGLGRNGNPVTKTFDGDIERLMETVKKPRLLKHEE